MVRVRYWFVFNFLYFLFILNFVFIYIFSHKFVKDLMLLKILLNAYLECEAT